MMIKIQSTCLHEQLNHCMCYSELCVCAREWNGLKINNKYDKEKYVIIYDVRMH